MKRVLLDQGLAPMAAAILRQQGFDAVHVAEIGMDHAADIEILERARKDNRVCVTLDHAITISTPNSRSLRAACLPLFCCAFRGWMRAAKPI